MKNYSFLSVVFALVIGVIIGHTFTLRENKDLHDSKGAVDMGEMKLEDQGMKTMNHEHEKFIIPEETESIPAVTLSAEKDALSGWNVYLATTNFKFAPEEASLEHAMGEGHAHLYIDGNKWGRVYGNWVHIDGLSPEKHEFRVTLNTNDHKDYVYLGDVIADSVEIE